jgi:hypothetical protein
MWRVIADRNRDQLTDLRRLRPGMRLAIPAVDAAGAVPGTTR